jgi:hypothetical protein
MKIEHAKVILVAVAGLVSTILIHAESPAGNTDSGAAPCNPRSHSVRDTEEAVVLSVSGMPVLKYQSARLEPPEGMDAVYAGNGFIHPLHTPSGGILTDPFPVGHAHQHGVFSAWTRATFHGDGVDFWNKHKLLGYSEAVSVGSVNPRGVSLSRRQVSLEHGPALNETWDIIVHDRCDVFVLDIVIRQQTATEEPVYLEQYHYGGFAFRGSASWNSEDSAGFEGHMKILTGNGTSDREAANHEQAGWVAAYGLVEGKTIGVVIMDHPSNFRYPQPVRIHPVMPYFVFSPVVSGPFSIEPSKPYKARYRLITFDGAPQAEQIAEWYSDFTKVP